MTAYTKQTWVNSAGGATPISAARLGHMEDGIYDTTPVLLYDASPGVVAYSNQEVVRIVGQGGAHPCQGTFTPTNANPMLIIEMFARVFGGALVDTTLVIGVRAGNDPTTPIAKPDPVLGTAIAATGVTGFQKIGLPAFGWEQTAASFHATVVFGQSRTASGGISTALTPGTTYIWQLVQTVQSAATTVTVGANPTLAGLSPDSTMVWVVNSGANTVTPVSLGARPLWMANGGMKDVLGNPMSWYPVAGTAIALPAGSGSWEAKVSPNNAYVAVSNRTTGTVSIINVATKAVIGTTAVLAALPVAKSLAWNSGSTVVWVALTNGTIVPITAATLAVGGAVTVAAAHAIALISAGGTTGWVVDLTTPQVFPLTGMTGGAVTVGGAIALANTPSNALAMILSTSILWVYTAANNSLIRITPAGVQTTTALVTALASCTSIAVTPDGGAVWVTDNTNSAILGFDVAGLQQSYYTFGGPVAGAYGVLLTNIDDIIVTLYSANGLRVWPSSYIDIDYANGFPPNQGVSVIAQGVTVP